MSFLCSVLFWYAQPVISFSVTACKCRLPAKCKCVPSQVDFALDWSITQHFKDFSRTQAHDVLSSFRDVRWIRKIDKPIQSVIIFHSNSPKVVKCDKFYFSCQLYLKYFNLQILLSLVFSFLQSGKKSSNIFQCVCRETFLFHFSVRAA